MKTFRYKASDGKNRVVTGDHQALSESDVVQYLLGRQLMPLKIELLGGGDVKKQGVEGLFRRKIKTDEVILFSRQMYSLTKAGVPIIKAIRTIASATENKEMVSVLADIAIQLESGKTLSQSLTSHTQVFNDLYINIVGIGEQTGALDLAFLQIGQYLDRDKETMQQVKSALRYPVFVFVAIGIAMVILNVVVLPAFKGIFDHFKAELPLPTKILMGVSDFTVHYWWVMAVVSALSAWCVKLYFDTQKGRFWRDEKILAMPIVGKIVKKTLMERFCRSFALMNSTGVPIIQGLFSISNSIGNLFIADQLKKMYVGIEKGESVSSMAVQCGVFPPIINQILLVGEETGRIAEMLLEMAEFYEKEIAVDIKNLSSSIEPIMIAVIGVMVLVLALGVFLPMWNLAEVFNQ